MVLNKTKKKEISNFFVKYNVIIYLFFQVMPYCFVWFLFDESNVHVSQLEILLLTISFHIYVILMAIFFNFLEKKYATRVLLWVNTRIIGLIFLFLFCIHNYFYLCFVCMAALGLSILLPNRVYPAILNIIADKSEIYRKDNITIKTHLEKDVPWFLVNNRQLILLTITMALLVIFFNTTTFHKVGVVAAMFTPIALSSSLLYFISQIAIITCFNVPTVGTFKAICETCLRYGGFTIGICGAYSALIPHGFRIPENPIQELTQTYFSKGYTWGHSKDRNAIVLLQGTNPTVTDEIILLNCCFPGTNRLDPQRVEDFSTVIIAHRAAQVGNAVAEREVNRIFGKYPSFMLVIQKLGLTRSAADQFVLPSAQAEISFLPPNPAHTKTPSVPDVMVKEPSRPFPSETVVVNVPSQGTQTPSVPDVKVKASLKPFPSETIFIKNPQLK